MTFRLSNFLDKVKKYAFKYKSGFYITPFLANSPQLIFESIKGLPFVKHNKTTNCLTTSSIFAKGDSYFHEVEDGLWVYFSELHYKVNIETKMFYDNNLPADYYTLSYNIVSREESKNFALVNGISFSNYSWNILKPQSAISVINFKGTKNKTMGLYISEKWAKENLFKIEGFEKSSFESFFSNSITNSIWQEQNHHENSLYKTIKEIVELQEVKKRKKELSTWAQTFLKQLTSNYPTNHNSNETPKYDADLHRKMVKVENKLMSNLLSEFPGIDALAKHVNISPTKLKTDFKLFYSESVYQYYLNKKLEYALLLLKSNDLKVNEISRLLNYENEANFTRAFKTKYNVLPSQIKKISIENSLIKQAV